jgi:hypothetical protein
MQIFLYSTNFPSQNTLKVKKYSRISPTTFEKEEGEVPAKDWM